MNKDKEIAMNQTYRQFLNAGMGLGATDVLAGSVEDGLMGFGTAIDEKVFGLGQLKEMIAQQTAQSKDMDLRWEIKPLSHYTSADGNTAVFADDLFLYAMVSGEAVEMYLRFSVVLTYANYQWKVLHWHGSKPENVQSDSDTFGIENWKQKAEALEKLVAVRTADLRTKNRELEIETALEKVRAIAMGMKVPTDMLAVCETIAQQMEALGVTEIRNVQTAIFYPAKGTYTNYEYYQKHQKVFLTETTYSNNEKHAAFADDMQKGAGQFFELNLSGDEVKEWLTYQKTTNVFIDDFLYEASSLNYYWCSLGPVALGLSTYESLEENGKELFKRFSNVFDLAYRRYLDIEKAEAQAKEAEIELALERVRARTMAMQHSDELAEISLLLDSQVRSLGIKTRGCAFNIYGEHDSTEWFSSEAGTFPTYKTPRDNIFLCYYEAGRRGEALLIKEFPDEACATHYEYLCTVPVMGDVLKKVKESGLLPVHQIDHVAYFKYGYLLFITFEPAPEAHDIFVRFAKVFEQTYTRFLDLQKAEAQAREAQINLAVERVRARALAMFTSAEILEVVFKLKEEVMNLHIPNVLAATIYLPEKNGLIRIWDLSSIEVTEGKYHQPMDLIFRLEETDPDFFMRRVWNGKEKYFLVTQDEEDFKRTLQWLKDVGRENQAIETEDFIHATQLKKLYHPTVQLNNGRMCIDLLEPPAQEIESILTKMGAAFNLAYKRFEDLKNSEAQLKEAKIETALERVRARTMAMQQSSELAGTASVLFQQVKELGFETWSCGFCTWQKDNMVEVWMGAESGGLLPPMMIPYKEELTHHDIYNASLQGAAVHQKVWEGEALEKHYAFLRTIPSVATAIKQLEDAGQTLPAIQCYYAGFFNGGYLLLITKETHVELPDLTKRFASVFEQTYTRFLDLQKAEAQAREAQIETALERVRSRTLAMQKSNELAETSAVLFKQLILLGISPNRLYISIIKRDEGDTEFWITDEDGSKVSMAYEDNLNGNPTFKKMFTGWKQQKKSLVIAMEGEELEQYLQHLRSINIPFKGGLTQKRRWQYIAYFNKGFIGMASPDKQPKETVEQLERFASVFNLTYTRFNDLKIAEAHAAQAEEDLIKLQKEKQRAENALAELQATQKQLVQSEKMASLGELTAGIAHEIQNPLNFVNNFSEVNKELLVELKEEADKGNMEEVKAIAADIIDNEKKILYHGKRADAIVKGMLQHSRSSSGQKEPADINALCDEYLRLAYHGLRAKDKSFNATLKTDYDKSIPAINIVPQDVGRVVLNLLTNAFYAVTEKKARTKNESYEPTVSVATKQSGNKVKITVSDNGAGIPSAIREKIFQPFFTTKPTGQGTGLGLSMSYDIITKGHGGELSVASTENEGTAFTIVLPE